jgi:hypothetical protein
LNAKLLLMILRSGETSPIRGLVLYRGGTRLVAELAVGAVRELPEAEGDLGADGEVLLTQRLLHHLLEENPPPPLVDPHLKQLYLL